MDSADVDSRSKDKRSKMRQHRKPRFSNAGRTTSSSSQVEEVRGIIDVADSSDERYSYRPITRSFPKDLPDIDDLDLNDDSMENPQLQAGDFDLMSRMPPSVGGHFHFSSEKNWDSNELLLDKTEASEYFTLNLKLLNVGLKTIPFYKRMDYASSMFSKEQLLAMDNAAEAAEEEYQKVLKDHQSNPKINLKNNNNKKSGSAKSQRSTKVENPPEQDDELDELLNMTTSSGANAKSDANANASEPVLAPVVTEEPKPPTTDPAAPVANVAPENKDDIQQWLDNVLEE